MRVSRYRHWLRKCLWMIVVSVFLGLPLLVTSSDVFASAQSRRVVTDATSGYAIYGFDPVAYFTEHEAVRGKREYEHVWNGVSWLFSSRANLEVFKADPEVYAPEYGGHGALAMARGYASGCNPNVWALYGDRLFLFYTHTSRAAWAQAVEMHIQQGDEAWVTIEGTLSR